MEKTPKKPQKKYNCCACSFASNNLKDFNRHNSTTKHKNTTNAQILQHKKTPKKHKCEFCYKKYKHRASLFTHNKTCNHKKKVASFCLENASFCLAPILSKSKFDCSCGKSYKYKRGLSKHKKKCLQHDTIVDEPCEIIPHQDAAPLLKKLDKKMDIIMEENKFLKEKILSLELGTTIHNGDNNNYTINMFLNEKCKNAMNLEDFVEKIKFTLEDLQYTSDNGYASGISKDRKSVV